MVNPATPPTRSGAERVEQEFRKAIAGVVLHNAQVSARIGMSASESQSLHLLQLHGPLSPTELARLTGLSTGAMTGVVDRLEKLGFAHRDRHPVDRRRVVVSVDEQRVGREIGPYYVDQAAHLATVIGEFTEAELDIVARFLARLNDVPAEPGS